jgi:formylglycine-generating enzyme required for sulfatase activity
MPLLPETLLNKRYRIVHLLAEGPYGAVYRAWDVKEGRDFAVKEYLDPDIKTQQLFRAEARRLSSLSHPQLPAVRDHFSLEDVGQYLVSDYIDGVSLGDLLRQYGPLPEDLVIRWLQEGCRPLGYLHEKGALHLNVKPDNLRLTPAGDIFLVDTGLPGLGISTGTTGFAAPEQAGQMEITPASDIYGLGATLYCLLTGDVPADALRRQSGLVDLRPPREVNPDVSPYLSIAAMRALDLRPDVRYESADAFARALDRSAGPLTVAETRRTTRSAPVAPPPRRPTRARRQIEQRTIMALAALLAVVVIAGFAINSLSRRAQLPGGSETAATATVQSQIIAALTQLAPTITPTLPPTETPPPTPAPRVDPGTGARMLYVPRGVFRMGNDEGEPDERPAFIVRVDAFFIDETEVTNGQYRECVAEGACAPPFSEGATFHPAYYGDARYDDYPVIYVTWYQAEAFCTWRDARLPTEAEWERAASFDPINLVKTQYPWGDLFDGELVNYCDRNCPRDNRDPAVNDGHQDTAPVASYPDGQSHIGTYDMAGNVMEWVADWYDPNYYAEATDINPLGPLEGDTKSIRGGSWLSSAESVRTTARSHFEPLVFRANLGFRCAATP